MNSIRPWSMLAIAWLLLNQGTVFGDDNQAVGAVPEPMVAPAAGVVDLFDAIDRDLVEARFIPVGSHKATVVIHNKTNAMLDLDLPAAFGARHVLGQFGQGAAGGFRGGAGAGGLGGGGAGGFGQGGQNVGGGFGQGGGGQGAGQGFGFGQGGGQGAGQGLGFGQGGGGRGNGGFFRVKPDKKRRIVVQTVCLEHGKRDPSPRMQYAIVPLTKLTSNPATQQLCQDLSAGRIDQQIAQATTWNLENGLSWEALAALNRRESRWLGNEARFSGRELRKAERYLQELLPRVESNATSTHNATHVVTSNAAESKSAPATENVAGMSVTEHGDSNPWNLRYR